MKIINYSSAQKREYHQNSQRPKLDRGRKWKSLWPGSGPQQSLFLFHILCRLQQQIYWLLQSFFPWQKLLQKSFFYVSAHICVLHSKRLKNMNWFGSEWHRQRQSKIDKTVKYCVKICFAVAMVEKSENIFFHMLSYHHKSYGVESLFVRVVSHLFYSFGAGKNIFTPQHGKKRKILFATIKDCLRSHEICE